MKVQLESTSKTVFLNGVETRVWEGVTENGVPCFAFVARIAVANDQPSAEFDRDLQEHKPPSAEIQAIPLRMIL